MCNVSLAHHGEESNVLVLGILKPDELVAGDVDKTLSLLWHLVGIHVVRSMHALPKITHLFSS